jgi:hypothetical protein
LEVVTLSELVNSNSDVSIVNAPLANSHPGIARAVRELAEATDSTQQRAFALLKALTVFPQGEQLMRIKRFNFNAPFFLKHATELFDQGFIEVTTLQRLDNAGIDTQAKTLVVPRAIRECVRELMTPPEMRELNRRAADLYFGANWSNGTMKSPTAYRVDNANCGSGDISNASTIVVRLYNDAHASDDEHGVSRALGLALSYLSALSSGDHYHSAVTFCDQLLPNVSAEDYPDQCAKLKAQFGKCLRMIGTGSRSRAILLEVEEYSFPSSTKQSVLLNLALSYQDDDEAVLACEYARKVISIDKYSHAALQAQTILIELETDDPRRDQKLIAHEAKCRRQKADVAANNIAILRARESARTPQEKIEILAPIMVVSRETKDHYNQTRAIIELSKLALDAGKRLGDKELSQLINSYHFLFNERIPSLFDSCHDALWKSFSASKDKENLLNLFRHSSLYWRLRGQERREKRFLTLLAKDMADTTATPIGNLSREAAYFRVRAGAVGLLGPSKDRLAITAST